ncbi:MAG: PDDEXK nuclease domain-containing protein [Peptococcaceae bacterium]|nr:PDDEXK nuclease domain-containing protein [Peptococcaceae bacterium]
MSGNELLNLGDAAIIIKDAIVRSRYQAAKLVNRELLSLYYAVGKYVSENSRDGSWGHGALKQLSEELQRDLPGLRGFSETSIKRMRLFYEAWESVFSIRPLTMDELELVQRSEHNAAFLDRPLSMDDFEHYKNDQVLTIITAKNGKIDLSLFVRRMTGFAMPGFSADAFMRVGFTHHSEILAKEKSLDGRFFYIAQCAASFWTVDTLKTHLRGNMYSRLGLLPSNFLQTLPEPEQARRAIRAFKDEYFLDFISIEDENDPDERVLERGIISNIKRFILSFGNYFSFIGNRYRVMVDEQEYFIDLLFFNRELRCLVAVELKRGAFNPSHLGQLNFYLSALDEYVRLPDEAPSIGILLCKEARRNTVEFAVRDYTKPMGVATYRTRNDMPEKWQKALPDVDDMKMLLEAVDTEQDEVGE